MPKHKSKTDRPADYSIQAEERRSERQVALRSMEDIDLELTEPEVPIQTDVVATDTQVPSTSQESGPSNQEFHVLKQRLDTLTGLVSSLIDSRNTIPVVSDNNIGVIPPSGSHEEVIQNAVDQHISSLLSPSARAGEVGSFIEADRSIDVKVPDSIKQQIWSNQYVDLNKLVNHRPTNDSVNYQWISMDGQAPQLAPAKSTKSINTLGQWCDAFLVYLTIYTKKYPSDISKLTSYMASVKLLHSRGGDFLYYDQEFRYLRQIHNIPWDRVHSGLWLECRDARTNFKPTRGKNNSFRPQSSTYTSNNRVKVPYGFCFAYHTKGNCTKSNCTYLHRCFINNCNSVHPSFKCNKQSPVQQTSQSPSKSNPQGDNSGKS